VRENEKPSISAAEREKEKKVGEKEEIEGRARCLCVEKRERKSDWWDALTPVEKEENLRGIGGGGKT